MSIDRRDKALELMEEMKAHLPIPVHGTAALVRLMREQGTRLARDRRLEIRDVYYAGDEGGIVCDVTPATGSEQAYVVSLTHLRVDPHHPLAPEIRSYQTERTQRIAESSRPAPKPPASRRGQKGREAAVPQGSPQRARRVPQSDVTWLCSVRRAPAWVQSEEGALIRPYLVIVIEQETDRMRQLQLLPQEPTPDIVIGVLLYAMQRPPRGAGKPLRPARVWVDDADLARALGPGLAEVGVRCEYRHPLPMVQAALRALEAGLADETSVPALLGLPGVSEPLAHELYAAAADYYRQAPWQWIDSVTPIEVLYPSDGEARYAIVMGGGGEAFGLSVNMSFENLEQLLSGAGQDRAPMLGVVFSQAHEMPLADLDAAERYGWPIAGELAYPLILKMTAPGELEPPSAFDIAWLAAALRTLPNFVLEHLRNDRGPLRPARETYALPNVHGGQKIALRYPARPASRQSEMALPELEKP